VESTKKINGNKREYDYDDVNKNKKMLDFSEPQFSYNI